MFLVLKGHRRSARRLVRPRLPPQPDDHVSIVVGQSQRPGWIPRHIELAQVRLNRGLANAKRHTSNQSLSPGLGQGSIADGACARWRDKFHSVVASLSVMAAGEPTRGKGRFGKVPVTDTQDVVDRFERPPLSELELGPECVADVETGQTANDSIANIHQRRTFIV
jgi:hypothetical protein